MTRLKRQQPTGFEAKLPSFRPSESLEMSTDLAVTYAALILADEDIEITADKIIALTSAASVEVEPIWATLLTKALEGKNVKDLLLNVSSGASAPISGQSSTDSPPVDAPPVEELEVDEGKEDSDDELGLDFDLFD